MEPCQEHLKQLAALFKAAQTPAEREILLQGVRIISAKDYEVLEEIVIRNQVREMPLPRVISLIAEQRSVPDQQAEEMVRDLILDHLLDRAKLRLDGGIATAQGGAQRKVTAAPSVLPVAAPYQIEMPQHPVAPSSNQPPRPCPAVVILKETEEAHQYPPPDLEQRGHHAGLAKGDARQPTEQGGGSPLMPKGVG